MIIFFEGFSLLHAPNVFYLNLDEAPRWKDVITRLLFLKHAGETVQLYHAPLPTRAHQMFLAVSSLRLIETKPVNSMNLDYSLVFL